MINSTRLYTAIVRKMVYIPVVRYHTTWIVKKCKWGGRFLYGVEDACHTFLTKDVMQNPKELKRWKKDIIYKCLFYDAQPDEYFLFNLKNIPEKEARTYLYHVNKDRMCRKVMPWSNYLFLSDKYGFYLKMQDFFKRECVKISDEHETESLEIFKDFVSRHPNFIAKPLMGSMGENTAIYNVEDDAERVYHQLFSIAKSWILEELIVQSQEMAKWNTSSVNSIRLPSILNKSGFHVIYPIIRMGREGSCIDNTSAGGVFALIDSSTGTIVSDGYDRRGGKYIVHPDSKQPIKGAIIPEWNSLLRKAQEAQERLDGHIYVGWDFAHTKDGWVLIEGNWGEITGGQVCSKIGIKEDFYALMNNRK